MIEEYLKKTKEEELLKDKIRNNKNLYDLEVFNKLTKIPHLILSSIFFLISMIITYYPTYIQEEINNIIMKNKNYVSYLTDILPRFKNAFDENYLIDTSINTSSLYKIIIFLDIDINNLYTTISVLFFIIVSISIFYTLKLIKIKEDNLLKAINGTPRELAIISIIAILIASSLLLICTYQKTSLDAIAAFSLVSSILLFGIFILLKIISSDLKSKDSAKEYTLEKFISWVKRESILKDKNEKLKNKIMTEYDNADLLSEIKKINIHDYDDNDIKKVDIFIQKINEFNKKEEKKKEWIKLLTNKEQISIKTN